MLNTRVHVLLTYLFVIRSIGENIKILVDRTDGIYVFRLNKERVYYVRFVRIFVF